jgi:hypothetical protein
MDYADDFSDDTPPPMKRSGIGGGWVVFSVLCLMIFGCAKQAAPPPVADSAATAKAVHAIEGKHPRTFRGPADILGDTTKNARTPPMVREP